MTGLRDGTPEEAGLSASRLGRASELAASFVESGDHPAVVVLIARHGVVALHEAFGKLGPNPDDPPLPRDALFKLSSIGKTLTATAAMILVDEGRLGLTRRVCDYLPEFRGDGREQVYVHHLMTHTAGLERVEIADYVVQLISRRAAELAKVSGDRGADPSIQLALERPVHVSPGTEMFYDSANFDLLGEIVTRVSDRPLGEVVHERIFEPLGMADSFGLLPDPFADRLVRASSESTNPILAASWSAAPASVVTGSGGGFFSTVLDMGTFAQMFLDGGVGRDCRVLSPAAVSMMTTNQIPGVPGVLLDERHDEASWGFGWGVAGLERWSYFPVHAPGTFWHSGASGVHLWCDPGADFVGVWFSAMVKEIEPDIFLNDFDLFVNAVTAAIDE
jgi:CubicO group peptidase (beta-lactamase class C family)